MSSSSTSSSIRFLTLLLVIVIVSSLYKANINKCNRYVSLSSSSFLLKAVPAAGALGSDILQRPDDEDSPEFALYLKQLMALQINRAKAGFASPSSASSDAYIAKLNRIKLEKLALRKAGLPEDSVDTSYKKEDYVAAQLEAQEPLVSNSVLTGEAAIAKPGRTKSGAKTRDLTDEEIAASRAAEATVAAALARQASLPEDQRVSVIKSEEPKVPVIRIATEDEELINSVLGKAASSGNTIAAKALEVSMSDNKSLQEKSPQPSYTQSLRQAQQSKNQQSQTPQKNEKVNQLLQQAKDQLVEQKKTKQSQQQLRPQQNKNSYIEAVQVTQPEPQPQISQSNDFLEKTTTTEYGRKLSVEELEVSAKALQLLVKHRGGGPFGTGRLVGSEVKALEKNLRAAYSMLENDIKKTNTEGKLIVKEVKASNPNNDFEPLPDLKKVVSQSRQEPEIVAQKQPAAITTASVKAPIKASPAPVQAPPAPIKAPVQAVLKPVQAAPVPAQVIPAPAQVIPAEGPIEVPISQGLQDFLTAPQSLSVIELNGLRDGLIQCLSMIQMEIMKRPADSPTNMPLAPIAQPPQVDPMQVIERAIKTNEKSSNDEIEKDIKVALGLLLKHRGGPGFGHGRLQGKELSLLEVKLRAAANLLLEEAV